MHRPYSMMRFLASCLAFSLFFTSSSTSQDAPNFELLDKAQLADCELHVIGIYAPEKQGTDDRVFVEVKKTEKPIVLVMASYNGTQWHLKLDPEANVKQIIISGYFKQELASRPSNIPTVFRMFFPDANKDEKDYFWAYGWHTGEGRDLKEKLQALTGLDVTTFQGEYNGSRFIVDGKRGDLRLIEIATEVDSLTRGVPPLMFDFIEEAKKFGEYSKELRLAEQIDGAMAVEDQLRAILIAVRIQGPNLKKALKGLREAAEMSKHIEGPLNEAFLQQIQEKIKPIEDLLALEDKYPGLLPPRGETAKATNIPAQEVEAASNAPANVVDFLLIEQAKTELEVHDLKRDLGLNHPKVVEKEERLKFLSMKLYEVVKRMKDEASTKKSTPLDASRSENLQPDKVATGTLQGDMFPLLLRRNMLLLELGPDHPRVRQVEKEIEFTQEYWFPMNSTKSKLQPNLGEPKTVENSQSDLVKLKQFYETAYAHDDKTAATIAEKYRTEASKKIPDANILAGLKQQLKNEVSRALFVQLLLQETRLKIAELDLQHLAEKHQRRRELRQKIIQRRVEELLSGEDLSWPTSSSTKNADEILIAKPKTEPATEGTLRTPENTQNAAKRSTRIRIVVSPSLLSNGNFKIADRVAVRVNYDIGHIAHSYGIAAPVGIESVASLADRTEYTLLTTPDQADAIRIAHGISPYWFDLWPAKFTEMKDITEIVEFFKWNPKDRPPSVTNFSTADGKIVPAPSAEYLKGFGVPMTIKSDRNGGENL